MDKLELLKDMDVTLSVVLGTRHMKIKDILSFETGFVVDLNEVAGSPASIQANGIEIAKGEIVVIDETYAVRIVEILNNNGNDTASI